MCVRFFFVFFCVCFLRFILEKHFLCQISVQTDSKRVEKKFANIKVYLRLIEALEMMIWCKKDYQFQYPDRPIHHFSV